MVTPETIQILLIEDDEDDALLTREMLRDAGPGRYSVTWSCGYDDGLTRLLKGPYDVALVDYQLGERDGVQLLAEAVSRRAKVPIILLTGQSDPEVDLAAMNAGAADFLNKAEVNASQLDRTIRYAIQQRKMEEQRLRLLAEQTAREKAEAASQAKDQFLAVLSHELRTPLTPVLMAADALRHDLTLAPAVRSEIEMIHRNVQLEARLIDDLLDITRITRGKLELQKAVLDIHEQIRHVVEICAPDAKAKSLRILSLPEATNPFIKADPARLQQVLWNLVKNSVKFTPERGSITLRTSNLPDGSLSVRVTDTGVGIDPQSISKIFDAFEQGGRDVTRQFGGLGLGLAITKALVERHGGSIHASSEGPGHGATFEVVLPGAVAARPASDAAPSATGPVAGMHRILLVEDHPDTSRVMCKLLGRMGYGVTAAGSVAAALEAAAASRFDLLISDLGLPDGSGLDLLRLMRDIQPVPGIALSGYGMDDDVSGTQKAGYAAHLVKPVDVAQLEAVVARLLREPRPAAPATVE